MGARVGRAAVWLQAITGAAFCAFTAVPAQAGVTQCLGAAGTALCGSAASPCNVSGTVQVDSGAVLDCSGIDVVVAGSLQVASGRFSLVARNLTVTQGHDVTVTPSSSKRTGAAISLTGSLVVAGTIAARNAGGGSFISVTSNGDVSTNGTNGLAPSFDVSGINAGCDGGAIVLDSGGNVELATPVFANGSVNGGDLNPGSGGVVNIQAAGSIAVREEIRAFGLWFDGGLVTLDAGTSVLVDYQSGTNLPKGRIVAEGRGNEGYGGEIGIYAGTSATVSGPLSAGGGVNNTGGDGAGGQVVVAAGAAGVLIDDYIDVRGGSAGGGSFISNTPGPFTLASTIDGKSRHGGGDGGLVTISSGGLVTIQATATMNVDGHASVDGQGGIVLVQGCQVDLQNPTTTATMVSGTGVFGAVVSLEGAKTSLGTNGYSLRVGNNSRVDVTGSSASGQAFLEVAERRLGKCSNNVNATCQTDVECVFGCATGMCNTPIPNPSTAGTTAQFSPNVVIQQGTDLYPCAN